MRAIFLAVRKDLLQSLRSPLRSVVFLLFPVVFALLIGAAFGGGGGGRKLAPIRIALVDEDGGPVARLAGSAFTQSNAPVDFEVTPVEMPEATRLVENDKVSAVVRIPKGFSDSLFTGSPTEIYLVRNPAQSISPEIVKGYVEVLALAGSAASRILGEPLREIRDLTRGDTPVPPADVFISRVSVAINHRVRGVGRYVLPPAIRLEKAKAAGPAGNANQSGSPLSIALFVLPGMATFSLLTLALAAMADLRREESAGTLSRQLCAPAYPWSPILGKIASTLVVALACILVLSLVAAVWARAGVSPAGFAILSFAFAFAATGFATLIQSLFASERAGMAVGSIVVMVMSMLGGSWIPLDALPSFVRGVAPLTLNYWANEGYRSLIFDSATLRDLAPNLGVLFAIGAGLTLVALRLLRRRYMRGA